MSQVPIATAAPERIHAILSASSAHRWLVCTPSARLEETFPETTSQYAEEGRLAHDIAELKLRKCFIEPMSQRTFANRLKKFTDHDLYQEEMLRHTDTYMEYIQGIVHSFSSPPYIAVEKKLDFSKYVPEGFGTGDCIIISGSTLWVVDFKYGKGVPVSAEQNPQMMLYALGAYEAYNFLYPIKTVKMAIVQPRLDSISEWEISINDLLAWGQIIKPVAEIAWAGEGEFVSGEHCKFCRARSLCRARAEFNMALEEYHGMKPPLISNEEVGQILAKAQDLVKWVKDLEEYALAEILNGSEIPGWKVVEGRTSRQYVDQDTAFKALTAAGIDEAVLYERKPLTVAQVEKVLGKAEYRKLLEEPGLVKTEPGKPTLVPITDKREPIKRPSAADDFKN